MQHPVFIFSLFNRTPHHRTGEPAVEEAGIAIAGSGDCNVFSNGDMEVSIAGSGDVQYKGNARVDAGISGSGKVFSKD